jgi:hypothetical protein
MLNHLKIETVSIDLISCGDCIFAYGDWKTVCKKDITQDSFYGIRIFGLTFRENDKKVKRVVLRK